MPSISQVCWLLVRPYDTELDGNDLEEEGLSWFMVSEVVVQHGRAGWQ